MPQFMACRGYVAHIPPRQALGCARGTDRWKRTGEVATTRDLVAVPDRPGLGLELNPVERYAS
jgi:hypothetical protein